MTEDVTQLLIAWTSGDESALDKLTPLIYAELRALARSHMRKERPDHSLGGTALVHEAYVRLVKQERVKLRNRAQFFGLASHIIRGILVDHARNHARLKRGGGALKLSLSEGLDSPDERELDLVRLDDAMCSLGRLDQRHARIVELRFFGGLSIEETADVLSISPATVKRDWTLARAWLQRELTRTA